MLFYLFAYTLATIGAFAVIVALGSRARRRLTIEDYRAGLWNDRPWLALAMTVFMLALLGFPIFGGIGLLRQVVRPAGRARRRRRRRARRRPRAHDRDLAGYYLRRDGDVHEAAPGESRADCRVAAALTRAVIVASATCSSSCSDSSRSVRGTRSGGRATSAGPACRPPVAPTRPPAAAPAAEADACTDRIAALCDSEREWHPSAGIFRQYDIRGIVGRDLTVDARAAIGRAYASPTSASAASWPVAVGRDNRPSGGALRDALVGGLTSAGVDVVDIGVVPTPLLYWSLHTSASAAASRSPARTIRRVQRLQDLRRAPSRCMAKDPGAAIAQIDRGISRPGRIGAQRGESSTATSTTSSPHRPDLEAPLKVVSTAATARARWSRAALRPARRRRDAPLLRERRHVPQPSSRPDGRREPARHHRAR